MINGQRIRALMRKDWRELARNKQEIGRASCRERVFKDV